jgi:sugar/nucleoside kinase (ribokinase family)
MGEWIDIVVSGHLCLDLLPQMAGVPLHDLPTPGRLFEIGALAMSTGGAVSNTGLALHRLGAEVRLMSSVGDDLLGQVIIAAIKQRDPALSDLIRVRTGEASSYTVVLSPENVDRIFLHCPGTNATFSAADIDTDALHRARLFHLGYPPIMPRLAADDGAELVTIYRQAKAAGAATALDMSMPDPDGPSGQIDWRPVLTNTLPYVDIFLPSIDEIVFMLRRADYDAWDGAVHDHVDAAYLADLADELLAMGTVIAGFKLGDRGAYLHTASDPAAYARLDRLNLAAAAWTGQRVYQPVFAVEVAGTTGAGDATYAGLLAALLRGLTPVEALRWACAVGACNVETVDATSGIQSWAATQARLDAGWPVSDRRVPGF